MHVIHIAAEFAPFAKAGGLADVLLGLCRALAGLKHKVDVLLPKYDCLRNDFFSEFKKTPLTFETRYRGEIYKNSVYEGRFDNLKLTFIHPESPLNYFDRGVIYGEKDDIDRFAYFAKAAVDYIEARQLKPDIIQTHDWQTGLIPLLLKEKIPVVQTIHNLHYQGRCDAYHLDHLGLQSSQLIKHIFDPQDPKLVNFLKAGILYSQAIVTVSPTYSKEILTKQTGEGLDEVLAHNRTKLHGILNGIDYSYWNPESDLILPISYNCVNLEGKEKIKEIVKKNMCLAPTPDKPLVCCISRLVPQKGLQLMKRAIYRTVERGGQFILVGSSPIDEVTKEFHHIKETFKGNRDVAMVLSFEHELVHWIYSGSDIIVVPSIFEPCGLTQLIALRYGTIPVVRKTGGLADTVFDLDGYPESGNGFTFEHSDHTSLDFALDRALNLWHNDRSGWKKLVRRAMREDHSWSHQVLEYLSVYQKLSSAKKIYEFA